MAGRRKKKSIIPALLVIMAVIALSVWLILVNFVFVVRDVQIVGNGDIPAQDVIRLSHIEMGGRLDKIDEAQLSKNVESDGRLAYEGIEIIRPNSVILNVRVRTKDCMTLQGTKLLVMDSDGYVIEVYDTLPNLRIPYVTGLHMNTYSIGRQVDAEDARIAAMKSVVEAVNSQNAASYISEISVADPEHIQIVSRSGIYVSMGDSSNMINKIIWMTGAIRDLESRGQYSGTLDVASGTKADFSGS